MEIVIRSALMYLILLLMLRLTTRRLMRSATPLDMALVFIFGGLATQAIILDDHSISASVFAMATITVLHVAISLARRRFPALGDIAEGVPIVIYRDGQWDEVALMQSRVMMSDVLSQARQNGYADLTDVTMVIVENNGGITLLKK